MNRYERHLKQLAAEPSFASVTACKLGKWAMFALLIAAPFHASQYGAITGHHDD